MIRTIILVVLLSFHVVYSADIVIDPKGYIVFCPCMGRFGNQADQFLGALNFAKNIDRTMVLPHWVQYNPGYAGSAQIPFTNYFQVEPLLDFHRVITMTEFMDNIAPTVWPVGKRTVFCFRSRDFASTGENPTPSCNAKYGNPFGPYWDNFNVDFDESEFYTPLYFTHDASKWQERYPADKWPVLAFTGAPAPFPVSRTNSILHKYLKWTDKFENDAEEIIKQHLPRPYVAAHLRIGSDWTNACKHVSKGRTQHLFASPQCLGESFQHGEMTAELCMPSAETVVEQIKDLIEKSGAKSVFIARDDPKYDTQIHEALNELGVKYYSQEDRPMVDLALLARGDEYIGNCISSFSSFATRERRSAGKSSHFWSFTPINVNPHEEL